MNDIKKGIQYAFQTENNMTISMSGSGHAAMECAVFNTVEPGESVLVAINGIWGERVAEIAERMGAYLRTHSLESPKKTCIQIILSFTLSLAVLLYDISYFYSDYFFRC